MVALLAVVELAVTHLFFRFLGSWIAGRGTQLKKLEEKARQAERMMTYDGLEAELENQKKMKKSKRKYLKVGRYKLTTIFFINKGYL